MRILIIESCVYEGSAWLEGWEGEVARETAEALVSMGKARWVWTSPPTPPSTTIGTRPLKGKGSIVEKAIGKRERG